MGRGKEDPSRDPGLKQSALETRELDFTEIRPSGFDYKYMLIFVDTFLGCVKAYPT